MTSGARTENDILTIRWNYYKKIRSQVESILGNTSKELKNYTKQYEDELKRCQYRYVTSGAFFKDVEKSDIMLVGDFHAQPQSARSLLRICRKMGGENVVLALECFSSKDQKHIDAYLAGDISEQDFLKSIEWGKNWGFPWEHTRALMKWAMTHHVPVYGMNIYGPKATLKLRDRHFAKVICAVQTKHKKKTVLTQVGDFHLAKKHLPAELKKLNRRLVVHSIYQSPDALYFRTLQKNKSRALSQKSSDFLDLNDNRWALMTVVPWVKWQDYLLFLESGFDKSIEVDEIDITDHVDRFINLVCNSIQLKLDNQNLSVYTSQEAPLEKALKKLNPVVRRKVKQDLKSNASFYIPELEMGVVSRLTVNHIARVAAQYILFKTGVYTETIVDLQNNFLKLIWLEMLTYFMTKLVNPKRKTDTLSDIRRTLSNAAFEDNGKEAMALSLEQKMKEIKFINFGSLIKTQSSSQRRFFSPQSYTTASTILGGVLGEKTFHAFHKKIIKFPSIQNFLFKKMNQKNFEISYYEAIEIIDSWPLPFKSKYDQF
jgi:uncharacterized iron-regulated protein